MAKKAVANFIEKASRLYEQERNAGSAAAALEMYVRRWLRWANGGVGGLSGGALGSSPFFLVGLRLLTARWRRRVPQSEWPSAGISRGAEALATDGGLPWRSANVLAASARPASI
jgi:hypothetical protein